MGIDDVAVIVAVVVVVGGGRKLEILLRSGAEFDLTVRQRDGGDADDALAVSMAIGAGSLNGEV